MAKETTKTPLKPTEAADTTPKTSTGGVLVLQWLTYAFYGWLMVALAWLTGVILTNAIIGTPVNGVVPYAIAATVVLLPLAFVTDFFYRKHEPVRKAGAATVIMVVHAVLFALIAIGALIVSVFTGLNAAINIDSGDDGTTVAVLVALTIAILYGALFLRTLSPFKTKRGTFIYAMSVLGASVLLLVLAVAGPVLTTLATRDDQRIERALPSIHSAVRSYATQNDKLPESLDDLKLRGSDGTSARELIEDGEIKYTAEGEAPVDTTSNPRLKSFRYQLCVEYDLESEQNRYRYNDEYAIDEYQTYVSVTPHDAGEVCYKLQTRV